MQQGSLTCLKTQKGDTMFKTLNAPAILIANCTTWAMLFGMTTPSTTPDRVKHLDQENMTNTIGGFSAVHQWPVDDTSSGFDNVVVETNFIDDNLGINQTSKAEVTMLSNSRPICELSVDVAPESGIRNQYRVSLDYPGFRDLSVEFSDGETVPLFQRHRLRSDLKVIELRFWNLQTPQGQTNLTAQDVLPFVDSTEGLYHEGSNTIDAIYGQCPVSKRSQFRMIGLDTLSISNNCLDASQFTSCSTERRACTDEIFSNILNVDPDLLSLHVVFVDTVACSAEDPIQRSGHFLGSRFRILGRNPINKPYVIAIEASLVRNDPDAFTRELAKQIGYTYVGINLEADDPDCRAPNAGANNVMCPNPGRFLTQRQCSRAANNSDIRYKNRNQ